MSGHIEQLAGTRWRQVDVVTSTGSTNADLAAAAAAGSIDGRVLIARNQTAGRGRHDREWTTGPAGALTFSVGVDVGEATSAMGWLSLLAGVAVADALARTIMFDAAPGVKWPNDVLIGERKVAGVLSEYANGQAVIGIGVNTSMTADQLPVPTATSVFVESGRAIDDDELAVDILRELDVELSMWPSRIDELAQEYRRKCVTLGQRVKLALPGDAELVGTAVDVDAQGRLLVAADGGATSAVAAGDVTHLRTHPQS
ncbi:biotin protein ligase [Gordonia araii NBRC 100433]|uniref:biotin--[biotin carboxyl-carrier protein] ligase n=1 Tax=Gordonia araii NBRC 100433 TaxID=1073574 RepID=G7GYS6_9ACTN|nr:biotin--[acetyl-CoA-carboxylase] ligase [Gordonia araii]NNG98948.1 biotin--[acetyl-CoA-carboxylase] ligase [Gordonia araii NBRC 100433]GAB08751.1 biotin protein ligase [Gordonia araii NBRC 100433]